MLAKENVELKKQKHQLSNYRYNDIRVVRQRTSKIRFHCVCRSSSVCELRAAESAGRNSHTAFVEVMTFAAWRISDRLKVDGEEQLSTGWVQVDGQSDTRWRRSKTVKTAAHRQTLHIRMLSIIRLTTKSSCKPFSRNSIMLTAGKLTFQAFTVTHSKAHSPKCPSPNGALLLF